MESAMLDKKNPMGLDGFEFLEFTSLDSDTLAKDLSKLGLKKTAKHKKFNVSLYTSGEIKFLINSESGFANEFAKKHGTSALAMGFRVKDANFAHKRALELGAKNYICNILKLPAIYGIGDSLIYFIDKYDKNNNIYQQNFDFIEQNHKTSINSLETGLLVIDHLTHNVHQGHMDKWVGFYEKLFNFTEIRHFDIEGKKTGLLSRAMGSPCGKIKIPINESKDPQSQIEEFITKYNGEGIQHIALTTKDIYKTVQHLCQNGINFLDVPNTYYEEINNRIPGNQENIKNLQKLKILIDGSIEKHEGILLQIFTENMLGPIFFEIIQRKGNEGFGEGNFQALFESIERDQIKRGVL
tara:strand:+ start:4471 stop:5532 length:1062 start_codon:yes stop_codon:yes gene_type:complete